MTKPLKLMLTSLAAVAAVFLALFYPYKTKAVPEWKIQVLDEKGQPVSGVDVHEEWMDPIDDGIVSVGEAQTDAGGWVVFPRRPTHNRLVLRILNPGYESEPRARAFVCWEEKTGAVYWDAPNWKLEQKLILHPGPCPYG